MVARILVAVVALSCAVVAQDDKQERALERSLGKLNGLIKSAARYAGMIEKKPEDSERARKSLHELRYKIDEWLASYAHLELIKTCVPAEDGWRVVYLGNHVVLSPSREQAIVARYLFLYEGAAPDRPRLLRWDLGSGEGDGSESIESRGVGLYGRDARTPIVRSFDADRFSNEYKEPLSARATRLVVADAGPWDVLDGAVGSNLAAAPLAFPNNVPGSSALARARGWLEAHQSREGRWDADEFQRAAGAEPCSCDGRGAALYDVPITGLALLALMNSGEHQPEGRWRESIRKGLRWLVGQQDAEGCIGARNYQKFLYGHAIATLALAEAACLSRSPALDAPLKKAVAFALKAQNPYKAWRYGEMPGDNGVSTTAWVMSALHRAREAGEKVPDHAFAWGLDLIDELTDAETGRTGNAQRGESTRRELGKQEEFPGTAVEVLTAAAIHVRASCRPDGGAPYLSALGLDNCLGKKLPVWDLSRGTIDMLYWYWGSLAVRHAKDALRTAWNQRIDEAMENQRTEGHAAGSFDPIGAWGESGGRVYATAMMILAAAARYRPTLER